MKLLALPITLITLGLVGLLINALMLLVLSLVSDWLNLPFKIANFPPQLSLEAIGAALIGGIIISVVASVLSLALKSRKVGGVAL